MKSKSWSEIKARHIAEGKLDEKRVARIQEKMRQEQDTSKDNFHTQSQSKKK